MTYNVFGGMLNLAHVGANVYGQDVKIHWKQKIKLRLAVLIFTSIMASYMLWLHSL